MCGLFGYVNYSKKPQPTVNKIVKALAEGAASRGTHATGISYVVDGKLNIEKAAQSAYLFKVDVPDDVKVVMGHTRFTTQGAASKNYNNHPFSGRTGSNRFFALAHNGIIYNEDAVRTELALEKPVIETDSYVAVQILEHFTKRRGKRLNEEAMKFMGEKVAGQFCFTVLDEKNNLFIVKNDNPLSIMDFKNYGIMVYASTTEILIKAIMNSPLSNAFSEALKEKSDNIQLIEVEKGDILKISPDGNITQSTFTPPAAYTRTVYSGARTSKWWEDEWDYGNAYGYGYNKKPAKTGTVISLPETTNNTSTGKSAKESATAFNDDDAYLEILVREASFFGITEESIRLLISFGYSVGDIEDAMYDGCFEALYGEALKFMETGIDSDTVADLIPDGVSPSPFKDDAQAPSDEESAGQGEPVSETGKAETEPTTTEVTIH